MDTEKRLVAFQTSRTDNQNHRHSNGGHRRFLGYNRPLQDYFDDSWVMDEDPETGDALPDEDWQLIDSGGNVILRGRDAIECETGVLDFDGIYDTVVVKRLEDCDENELMLTAETRIYVDKEILEYAHRMLDNCRLAK